jgi:hypothetical protein
MPALDSRHGPIDKISRSLVEDYVVVGDRRAAVANDLHDDVRACVNLQ